MQKRRLIIFYQKHNQRNHIICIESSSRDNPITEHVTPLYQNCAEYYSRYRSQKKGQASLNICNKSLINDLNIISYGRFLCSLQCKAFCS